VKLGTSGIVMTGSVFLVVGAFVVVGFVVVAFVVGEPP
jgi:hypothetical protein